MIRLIDFIALFRLHSRYSRPAKATSTGFRHA